MDIISNILKMVSANDTSLGVSVSHLFLFSLLVSCDILSDRRDLVIDSVYIYVSKICIKRTLLLVDNLDTRPLRRLIAQAWCFV